MPLVYSLKDEPLFQITPISDLGQRFAVKNSHIHGDGVFATMPIWIHHIVGYYEGNLYPNHDSLPFYEHGTKTYYWELSNGKVIDGKNDLRFINHSCDPNLESREVVINGQLHIQFYALRNIMPGEELTLNYRLRRDKGDKHQYKCFCGSSVCRGTMLDPDHKRSGKKRTRKK